MWKQQELSCRISEFSIKWRALKTDSLSWLKAERGVPVLHGSECTEWARRTHPSFSHTTVSRLWSWATILWSNISSVALKECDLGSLTSVLLMFLRLFYFLLFLYIPSSLLRREENTCMYISQKETVIIMKNEMFRWLWDAWAKCLALTFEVTEGACSQGSHCAPLAPGRPRLELITSGG